MNVTLDPFEVQLAGFVGVMRRAASFDRGGKPSYSQPDANRWNEEVEGACAELVVSKVTGKFWNAIARSGIGLPDCGDLHVRHTPRADGCLILHPEDPPAIFVLVTGLAPTFAIRGALHSNVGRVAPHWRTDVRHPAFFVPQSLLRPLLEVSP